MHPNILKKSVLILTLAVPGAACADTRSATLYKNPDCGCCEAYADHLRRAGFAVKVVPSEEMSAIKMKLQVPARLGSCHTTVIGKYVVEGHVPIDSVKRLLKEKPALKGIAVPGMPAGSPGMEAPVKEAFTVFAFTADGKQSAYGAY